MPEIKRIIPNLTPNTEYLIRVRAFSPLGVASNWSEAIKIKTDGDTTIPGVVQNLTVTPGIRILILNWDANTDPDFATYEIHVGTTSGFTPNDNTLISRPGPGTMEMITQFWDGSAKVDLIIGDTYYIKMFAVDISGNKSVTPALVSGTPGGVDDSAIDSISADKISAGTFQSIYTISGNISTATSGARMVLNSSGLTGYANDGTTKIFQYLNSGVDSGTVQISKVGSDYQFSIDTGGTGGKVLRLFNRTTLEDSFYLNEDGSAYFAKGIINLGSFATGFKANDEGDIWLGAATKETAPFTVSRQGAISLKLIGAGYIQAGTDVLSSDRYLTEVNEDDPISYWRFGETASSTPATLLVDEMGIADLTLSNPIGTANITEATGLLQHEDNGALQFTSTGKPSFTKTTGTANALELVDNATFEWIMHPNSASGEGNIFEFRDTSGTAYDMLQVALRKGETEGSQPQDKGLEIKFASSSTSKSYITIPWSYLAETYHCVLTIVDGIATFYANGEYIGTASSVTHTLDLDGFTALNITGDWGANSIVLDEIAMYSTILSTQRIKAHYNAHKDYYTYVKQDIDGLHFYDRATSPFGVDGQVIVDMNVNTGYAKFGGTVESTSIVAGTITANKMATGAGLGTAELIPSDVGPAMNFWLPRKNSGNTLGRRGYIAATLQETTGPDTDWGRLEIKSPSYGSTAARLTFDEGKITGMPTLFTPTSLYINNTSGVSLSSRNHPVTLGSYSGLNLMLDKESIQGMNNGDDSPIHLNPLGGTVFIQSSERARLWVTRENGFGDFDDQGVVIEDAGGFGNDPGIGFVATGSSSAIFKWSHPGGTGGQFECRTSNDSGFEELEAILNDASSAKQKYDIKDWKTKSALKKVNDARVRRFKFKGKDNPRIGMIAEELHKTIPEVVSYDIDGKPTGYSVGAMIAVLTKAVQEQQVKIEELEARLEV